MLKKLIRFITLSFFKKRKQHPKVAVRINLLKLPDRELTAFAENVHRNLAAFSAHYPMPSAPVEALREGMEALNFAKHAAQTDGSHAKIKTLKDARRALRMQLERMAAYVRHFVESSDAQQPAGFRPKPKNR